MKSSPSKSVSFHERLSSSEPLVQVSSDRMFGMVLTAFWAAVWIAPWVRGGDPRWWALAVSAAFLIPALIAPALLRPLNLLWAKLAIVLHHIVNPVVMAVVFYLAFTPTGSLMRAFGKDPLRLKRSPEVDTYWIPKDPQGPPPDTMIRQF